MCKKTEFFRLLIDVSIFITSMGCFIKMSINFNYIPAYVLKCSVSFLS